MALLFTAYGHIAFFSDPGIHSGESQKANRLDEFFFCFFWLCSPEHPFSADLATHTLLSLSLPRIRMLFLRWLEPRCFALFPGYEHEPYFSSAVRGTTGQRGDSSCDSQHGGTGRYSRWLSFLSGKSSGVGVRC